MSKGLTCSGEATIFPIMRVGSGKKTPVLGIVLAMVAMGVVRWLLPSATAHGPEVAGPYVVLVSIDGLAAYELEDEALELPHIREMIRQGVWAQSSETVFPSVTHPAHTTLITGVAPLRHGVIGNRLVNRSTGERFHITNRPRSQSIRVPTLFDAAKKRGLRTASFFWPENREDPSVDYSIPEVFGVDSKADIRAADPAFLDELRRGGISIDLYYRWYDDLSLHGAADAVLSRAAGYVIRTHRPHLLAIHILVVDTVQHEYGTEHYLSRAALTMADYCVGILRQAVRDAGLGERTSFFLVSDHGFQTAPYEVNLYPLFREEGLGDKVALHPGGWTLFIELEPDFDRARDLGKLETVFERALRLEGVSRVVRPEEYHRLGYPRYEEDPHVRGQYMIIGDIDTHLVADGSGQWTGKKTKAQPYHGHGYPPSHPSMYPAFVAAGYRIKQGIRIGHIRNIDVAPTIAHLLDLDLPGTEGRVLQEALVKEE